MYLLKVRHLTMSMANLLLKGTQIDMNYVNVIKTSIIIEIKSFLIMFQE